MGLDDVTLLGFQVRYFERDRQGILEELVKEKKTYNPDLVLTPSTLDIHQDHSTVSKESIRAFKDCTILGYELPWNNLSLSSTALVKLDKEDVDRKIEAIGKYESQKGRAYSDPEFIRSMAITRGTRIREKYAEAFEVIRLIY